jgi:mannose-6-phosphate isomerase class I
MEQKDHKESRNEILKEKDLRITNQFILPYRIDKEVLNKEEYKLFPIRNLGSGKIFNGYASLAEWIGREGTVILDGFVGIFWKDIQIRLNEELSDRGYQVKWVLTNDFLKPTGQIEDLVSPFLGPERSVWGTKCTLDLEDLFDIEALKDVKIDKNCVNICMGPGAGLVGWNAPIAYFDLPKNELQYRMRAGSVRNLGMTEIKESFQMYKHYYFIDWVLLADHKKKLVSRLDVIVDGQWVDTINWMNTEDFLKSLQDISTSVIRVRPWFEPGAWGGQWIKQHIPGLNKEVINYAWSFAFIVPENGLLFESDGYLMETSFDFLMFTQSENVLGNHSKRFKDEFPIRFNFLDTYDGGNLSIQCHPSLQYIRDNFGENITQDESYYILDCKKGAQVYLGFQDNIDPSTFKTALVESQEYNRKLEMEEYVQMHVACKHDLFLIPNGTIHSAGSGNMVLEISATPYIFTFKMYDWLRLDLNGKSRPINIDHAFENLNFELKGDRVPKELFSRPKTLDKGNDYEIIHYPTHKQHFYDIRRLDFDSQISRKTDGSCQVLMLVEGDFITLETENGESYNLFYAETFVIPAAAGNFRLINNGDTRARVINAYLKP